jgi:glucokinase
VRRFEEAVRAGRSSALADMVTAGQRLTSRDIYVAAVNGDGLSRETLAQTGAYLGVAVANMIAILDPEMIVFTGGMTAAGKLLLDAIKQEAQRRTFGPHLKGVKIVFGKLGNDAGLIGAAGCAFTRYGISA